MAKYQVHSFHLNIDSGDSAIHVLGNCTVAGFIPKSFVLIDAGFNNYGGWWVKYFCNHLKNFYRYPADHTIKFDAIVITHWDADHCGGIQELFDTDVAAQGKNQPEEWEEFFETYKPWFCKFDTEGAPLTHLYVPYWAGGESHTAQLFRKTIESHPLSWILEDDKLKIQKFNPYQTVRSVKDPVTGRTRLTPVQWKTSGPVAVVHHTVDNLLGFNIFQNKLALNDIQIINIVDPLIVSQNLEVADGPAMFCLLADSKICGAAQKDELEQWTWERDDQGNVFLANHGGDTDESKGDKEEEFACFDSDDIELIVGATTTVVNQSSIACMIIWPNKDKAVISHYFAGDLGDAIESMAIKWSTTDHKSNIRTPNHVMATKVSHHGAKGSTPEELFYAFDPKLMVVSNGMNSSWKHPKLEILLYVMAWAAKKNCIAAAINDEYQAFPRQFDFRCTNYPVYLALYHDLHTNTDDVTVNPGSVKQLAEGTMFRTQVERALKGVSDTSPLDTLSYRVWEDDARLKKAVVHYLINHWKLISSCLPKDYCTASQTISQFYTVSARQTLRAIYVVQNEDSAGFQNITDTDTANVSKNGQPAPVMGIVKIKRAQDTVKSHRVLRSSKPKFESPVEPVIHSNVVAKINKKTKKRKLEPKKKKKTAKSPARIPRTRKRNKPRLNVVEEATEAPVEATVPQNDTPSAHAALVSKYLFLPHTFQVIDKAIDSSKISILGADTSLSTFLALLKCPMLILPRSPPAAPVGDLKGSKCVVDDMDGLSEWFKALFGDSAIFYVSATSTAIRSFGLDFALGSTSFSHRHTPLMLAEGLTTVLKFQSDYGPIVIGNYAVLDPKFHPSRSEQICPSDILIMGLDPASPALTLSLSDICTFLECDPLFLKPFGQNMKFTVDFPQSPASRNAVWFLPDATYTTVLRLQFLQVKEESNQWLMDLLSDIGHKGGIEVTAPVKLIARKTFRWILGGNDFLVEVDWELSFILQVKLTTPKQTQTFQSVLVLSSDSRKWIIDLRGGWAFEKMIDFFTSFLPFPVPSVADYLPSVKNTVSLHRLSFTWQEGVKMPVMEFDCEILLGGTSFLTTLVLGPRPRFSGRLFPDPEAPFLAPMKKYKLMPHYEEYLKLVPHSKDGAASSGTLDLAAVFSQLTDKPLKASPFGLTLFSVDFMLDEDSVSFRGVVGSENEDRVSTKTPQIRLDQAMVAFQYWFKQNKAQVSASVNISLESNYEHETPIQMGCLIAYADQKWTLSGSLANLNFSQIYNFFDSDSDQEVMNILENIEIISLRLNYEYEGAVGSSFQIAGSLGLGNLELDYNYNYDSDGYWDFEASLNPLEPSEGATLLDIISSICGQQVLEYIPDCFKNVERPEAPASTDATTPPAVQLKIHRLDTHILFVAEVQVVAGVTVVFIQIQEKRLAGTDLEPTATKRIFFMKVSSLPTMKSTIPFISAVQQPFDEMHFAWVQGGEEVPRGISRKEVGLVNDILKESGQSLRYKEEQRSSKAKEPSDNDIMISTGCHFIIVYDGSVILDYCFSHRSQEKVVDNQSTTSSPPSKANTKMAPLRKQMGQLAISAFGLHFEGHNLTIKLTAAVELGVFGASLIDLGICLDLKEISLSDLSKVRPTFVLGGISLGLDSSPLRMAGLLSREITGNSVTYTGGVLASFEPYSMLGIGQYATTTDPNCTSLFAWLQFNGPLMQIGSVEITGVKVGFGYNTNVRNPDSNNICNFPFCAPSKSSKAKTPADLLEIFLNDKGSGQPWISQSPGTTWIAAGMEVVVCQTVNISTAVIVTISPKIVLNIFANGGLQMPIGVHPDKAYLNVQFGILCLIDFSGGSLIIQSCLASNSFILNPSCHLNGEFALCSWWGLSPIAGDWVFTVGGYHPLYKTKPHYPVPSRLKIRWEVDSSIKITGEAYFAITPEVVMAGGQLVANYRDGLVWATFKAWADFLVNLSPFWFQATIGIIVDAGISWGRGFFHVSHDFHFGANLRLYGPPVHGVAEFSVMSHLTRVYFGDDSGTPGQDALTFSALCELLLSQSKSQDGTYHVLGLRTGVVLPSKTPLESSPETPWIVRGGSFSFQVESLFPISDASVKAFNPQSLQSSTPPIAQLESDSISWDENIYSKPMQLGGNRNLSAVLTVDIQSKSRGVLYSPFEISHVPNTVSSALWGEYKESEDPMRRGNKIPSLLNPSGIPLIMMTGVLVSSPEPVASWDTLDAFDALLASNIAIFDKDHLPVIPSQPQQVFGLPGKQHNTGWAGLASPPENGVMARWGLDRPEVISRTRGHDGGLQGKGFELTSSEASDIDSKHWDEALDIWTSRNISKTRRAVSRAVSDILGWGDVFNDMDKHLVLFERDFGDIYLAPPRLAQKYTLAPVH